MKPERPKPPAYLSQSPPVPRPEPVKEAAPEPEPVDPAPAPEPEQTAAIDPSQALPDAVAEAIHAKFHPVVD